MDQNDKLIDCRRCGSNACYEQTVDDKTQVWLCMGCGFSTSTHFLKESEIVNQTIENLPELYKDLFFEDNLDLVWFPSTITLPTKGMVFIDGTSKENWRWAAVTAIPILDEEKTKYPEGQTHKMDMTSIKHFDQNKFMDALDIIGFYQF